MRIALISPLYESVPPKLYGGTERIVANLCRGLTDLGHTVTLFASGDSQVSAEIVANVAGGLRLSASHVDDPYAYHIAQLAEVARRADDFDVIHNHMDVVGFPLTLMTRTPVVTTLHGRLDWPSVGHAIHHYPEAALVSISDAQRLPLPSARWIDTVYHGLDLETFRFHPEPGRYLAFLGRISPEKGPEAAIAIARLAGVPLKIAAKVDPADRSYYEARIAPLIDGKLVEFIGEIGEHEKSAFLGEAVAMLFPIEWPEPFGLTPIEAWACGTPVLARPHGSVPELHFDGVTGYVRETIEDLAALVPRVSELDRSRCRAYAERQFSLQRMCKDYVHVYRKLTSRSEVERASLQLGKPDDRRWSVLHSFRRTAAGYRQDGLER